MKYVILLACCLNIFNAKATESEKIIKSKPEKIIVYTQGAQVHRNSQVNLVVVCFGCNNERGSLDFYQYMKMKNPNHGKKYF